MEKSGSRLNGYERIGTERNGFDPGKEHGVNPFFSVGICCYPFTLDPSDSVFIPFFSRGEQRIPTETGGSCLNGYERIGTDRNGFDPG